MTLQIKHLFELLPQEIVQLQIFKHLPMNDCAMLTYVSKAFSSLIDDLFLKTRAAELHFVIQSKGDKNVRQTFKRLFPIIRSLKDSVSTIDSPLPPWLKRVVAQDQSRLLQDFINNLLISIDSAEVSQTALAAPRMSDPLLSTLFLKANAQGRIGCVKTILQSQLFNKISVIDLEEGLSYALQGGHIHCVTALVACSEFNQISPVEFQSYIVYAAQHGLARCLKILMACPQFNTISVDQLGWSLQKAAQQGRIACLKILMACSRFHEITPSDLGWSLINSAKGGHVGCLNALIACSRFHEIEVLGLALSFKEAIKDKHIDCVKALMASPQFEKKLPACIDTIFSTAFKYQNHECIKHVIESALFNQMGFFHRFHYLKLYISIYFDQISSDIAYRHSFLFLFLYYLHRLERWVAS